MNVTVRWNEKTLRLEIVDAETKALVAEIRSDVHYSDTSRAAKLYAGKGDTV